MGMEMSYWKRAMWRKGKDSWVSRSFRALKHWESGSHSFQPQPYRRWDDVGVKSIGR